MSIERPQNQELCTKCEKFRLKITRIGSTDELFFLGFLETIGRRSRNCALCRLVYNFLANRGSSAAFWNHQIVLSPRFGVDEFAILCPNICQSVPLGWVRIIKSNERIPINDQNDAREIDEGLKTGRIQYKQVRSWLASCGVAGYHLAADGNKPWGMFSPKKVHDHPEAKETLLERSLDPRKMLLIDVIDECLVKGRLDVNFVALSYVWGSWGGLEVTKTTAESLNSFCQKGSLSGLGEKLPRVLSDAMEFVRGIGQRYLWCDLLCVVSDDPRVRDKQIQMMDAVYSEATLTIIALTGSHGNMELPGIRPRSRDPMCLSETLEDGSRLVIRHLQLTSFYDSTTYTKRAWTFQEELLSSRCLYITDRQMYFKCRFCSHREDDVLFHEANDENVDLLLNSFPAGHSSLANVGQDFELYKTLLGEYSRRQLTLDKDILRAFEGITSVLAREYDCQFWQGIPTRFLTLALLWVANGHIKHRFESQYHSRTGTEIEKLPPTWSWAAWTGRITYPQITSHASFWSGVIFEGPKIDCFLYGGNIYATDQDCGIVALDFLCRVRRIIASIIGEIWHYGQFDFNDFDRRLKMSELNAGGWSTESPTEDQASHITAFATCSIEMLQGNSREILDQWPFGYMECLLPDHPDNWWPSSLAIPTVGEIDRALSGKNFALISELQTPAASNPPLCFSASTESFGIFTIDGGQLVQESKTSLSSTYTTSTGLFDCDLGDMDFSERKHPLDDRSHITATSATIIFFRGEPLGVLFDFEADIKIRMTSEHHCSLIVISSHRRSLTFFDLSVMLVKRVEGGYERVAVGRIMAIDSASNPLQHYFSPTPKEKDWIRLY